MNLELLFAATRLSGDSTFYKVAVSHVDRTMKEQYRPDGSCYHVVDYSMKTVPYVIAIRHRDMRTNRRGAVDKLGVFTV